MPRMRLLPMAACNKGQEEETATLQRVQMVRSTNMPAARAWLGKSYADSIDGIGPKEHEKTDWYTSRARSAVVGPTDGTSG